METEDLKYGDKVQVNGNHDVVVGMVLYNSPELKYVIVDVQGFPWVCRYEQIMFLSNTRVANGDMSKIVSGIRAGGRKDISVAKEPKTIIYQDGNTVYAEDVNTGKMAKATCSPEDAFNYYVGANIALMRLIHGHNETSSKHKKGEKK